MAEILSEYQALMDKFTLLLSLVSLVIALGQCFFGYRYLRAWMALMGFLLGYVLGEAVGVSFVGAESYYRFLAGAVGGLLVALLAYKLYLIGVFLYCGSIASIAMMQVQFGEDTLMQVIRTVLCVAVFIAAGYLAVKLEKPVVILVTVVSGATAAMSALGKISESVAKDPKVFSAVYLALIGIGIVVQLINTRNMEKD